ncbi:DUF2442 domain-containing protein [Algoriphagus taiwanensis]|uniref:DUF2442 domain-containing protein n=1 Tax=Algoriphagus taiwanensis TaxID=1445656 RepID=A0ABQ6Q4Z9_9BACT|nr:hypothetical protein Ataiwa_35220 [Algoriphagus taiwanensis]
MVTIQFEGNNLIILKNGLKEVIDLKRVSAKLLEATEAERNLYKFSPSGYGIHWPLIDEDLSVEKLLKL